MQSGIKALLSVAWLYLLLAKAGPYILLQSYKIRLFAIQEFGPIIHEFDPYFNFRATEYLYYNGWAKFITWFDHKSWYPLGRPVGTTIYPGMQVTAVWIKNHIVGDKMSLNDVCVYIPCWFGVIATIFTGLLAYECSLPVVDGNKENQKKDKAEAPFGSILSQIPLVGLLYDKIIVKFILNGLLQVVESIAGTDFGLRQVTPETKKYQPLFLSSPALECGIGAAGIMAILPAHLMRSIGGGFDNECVAMAAMTMTFWLWTRSLRGSKDEDGSAAWKWGALCGVAYFYMVAAWGGYIFVLNLIGCHASFLVLTGRYSTKLHRAYSAFYIVGTSLAIQIPVVGLTPLKSLEQMAPLLAFLGMQVLEVIEQLLRKQRKTEEVSKLTAWKFRIAVIGGCAIIGIMTLFLITPTGYFGPISSRVRGLFVKHTKTGNPLVDSVAEHQPASPQAYEQWLDKTLIFLPYGFATVALRHYHDSSSFLLIYATATYFFSNKMVRLILLTAPIASALAGIVIGRVIGFVVYNLLGFRPSFMAALTLIPDDDDESGAEEVVTPPPAEKVVTKKGGKSKKKKGANVNAQDNSASKEVTKPKEASSVQKITSTGLVLAFAAFSYSAVLAPAEEFHTKAFQIGKQMSTPSIVQKGQLKNGEVVVIDDYRECYNWIRENTPEDARVLAWWDYGYQIAAIANRTTIADGNTWNHEHIALLGRILTSSEKEGHRIARHLADYALVWAGGGGDDLAKSPHLARIANSVYRHMCPGDPTCSRFGMTKQGPSQMMKESFLYKLHSHRATPGVTADPNRFQEVMMSKYGKCRVYKILSVSKESKEWVPKNRICDVEGGWYCRGQYPPALQKVLDEKKDFSQLEDFNKKDDDSEYQKKYFENLNKRKRGEKVAAEEPTRSADDTTKKAWEPARDLTLDEINRINSLWKDTEATSLMWNLISTRNDQELLKILAQHPEAAHIRSKDGRGPMWWAYEYQNKNAAMILKKLKVSDSLKDANGKTPRDVLRKPEL